MSADRNLLFGILALQMDFITRDQLVAGMHAWVLEKSKPLGQILIDQGALDADNRAWLDAGVVRHLATHNSDPQQSLAALGSVSSVRKALDSLADPDVQATLSHVSSSYKNDDPSATASYAVGASTSAGERFRILRPHAEGGLGRVSVARDEELGREVALKEIKERYADDAGSRGRFLLEAEITGGLEHPGIVPVYGLGSYADGRPFYAMRFIKGDSLKEAIDRFHKKLTTDHTDDTDKSQSASVKSVKSVVKFESLDFRKLLGRFIDVCNAIDYAHSRGVLHRDLKPGNIMLGKYGETLVVDWGLAKAGIGRVSGKPQGESSSLGGEPHQPREISEAPIKPPSSASAVETIAGAAMGTPAYMSPEQAAGRLDLLGPASDVYSLGATLYCLLTGRAPFEGSDIAVMLANVQLGEFPPPRQLHSGIDPALQALCLKAMATKPTDRYGTPRALADDIEHWLADEPVGAWPEPASVKLRRFVGRHRTAVTSAAAALVVAVLGSITAIVLLAGANETISQREKEAREAGAELAKSNDNLKKANDDTKIAYGKLELEKNAAEKARNDAEAARDDTEDTLAQSRIQLARARFDEGNVALAEESIELVPTKFRGSAWGLVKNGLAGSPITLRGHQDIVSSVAFTGDGQTLASGSDDETIKLWDARTGQELRTLRGHRGFVTSVVFAADGQTLASGSVDKTVKQWDTRTGKELRTFRGLQNTVKTVAFTGDGQTLASVTADNTIRFWDAQSGEEQEHRTLREQQNWYMSVAFTADGQTLASGSSDNTIKLWDARTGEKLRTLRGHQDKVTRLAFSADGQMLASGSWDSTIKLWDARTGAELGTLRGHQNWVMSVAFTADGQILASGSLDNTIKLWDARTGQELCILRGHKSAVTSMAFTADGQTLASGSSDNTIKLWDTRTIQELRTLRGHEGIITSVAFTPVRHALATGSGDNAIKLSDAWTGQEIRTLRGHQNGVTSVAFTADGQTLASGSGDKTVRLWDTRSGQDFHTLRRHENKLTSVAFTADGQTLASGSEDKTVKLWDARTGQRVRTLLGHQSGVASVAFATNGQTLASGSYDKTVKLWEVRTGQELRTLRGHLEGVTSVAFTADGQTLATGSLDKTVKLWDVRTGQELRTFRGHLGVVTSVAFTAEGQTLASGSYDKTVKLWDTRSAKDIENELYFRLWVFRPYLPWNEDQVKLADKNNNDFALAHHLGRYLATRKLVQDSPWDPASAVELLGAAPSPIPALAGYLGREQARRDLVAFPDPLSFTGVMYRGDETRLPKETGCLIHPTRLLIGAAPAAAANPNNPWNRAIHGGALYRAGKHKEAIAELTAALKLPDDVGAHMCAKHFLALTHHALGDQGKRDYWRFKAILPTDAPWPVPIVDRFLRREVEATLTKK